MTVRFYSSLDTGAPVLSGTRLIDQVKLVLMACLVNGYGSKSAAGWTVGHEHADGFSLSNGEGFVNFVHQSTGTYAVYIMESITDGSSALAGGYNRRSGPWYDGSSATARQYIYATPFVSGSNPHWSVVADGKTAILLLGASLTSADAISGASAASHYFGRYLNASGLGGFCSLGGGSGTTTSSKFFSDGAGMALRHPLTGVVEQGVGASYHAGAGAFGGLTTTSTRAATVLDRVQSARAPLLCYGPGVSGGTSASSAIYGGLLRGVVFEPYLCSGRPSEVFPALGSANTWQARVTLIPLSGGREWSPFYGIVSEPGGFVSLDPADWG
jgi:hypothetical protein